VGSRVGDSTGVSDGSALRDGLRVACFGPRETGSSDGSADAAVLGAVGDGRGVLVAGAGFVDGLGALLLLGEGEGVGRAPVRGPAEGRSRAPPSWNRHPTDQPSFSFKVVAPWVE